MVTKLDWKVADAKARFTDLIRESEKEPQVITRHGNRVSVVMSYENYVTLKRYEAEGQPEARIDYFVHFSTEIRGEDGFDLAADERSNRPGPDFSVD